MKIALFSDVHGNLEALNAVITTLNMVSPDMIVCLGDLVGYGPDPNACIEMVMDTADVVVAGNHDYAAVKRLDAAYFNAFAREAIFWTEEVLTESSKKAITALPLSASLDKALLVHATPRDPAKWDYVLNRYEASYQFEAMDKPFCFIGHSHMPVSFQLCDNGTILESEHFSAIQLADEMKTIINVGSVGQPRDMDNRAAFGIYDTSRSLFELHRCPYDIQTVQQKIEAAGLPYYLAARLERGQ